MRSKVRAMAEYPVRLGLEPSEDVLLLTNYMDAVFGHGNLARVRPDGSDVWRRAPRPVGQDVWIDVEVVGEVVCRAWSWEGWQVDLSLDTGAELARTWTK
jgi:hypothetical protein